MAKCKMQMNSATDPIDEQEIEVEEEGKVILVPALDERWVAEVGWRHYETPPLPHSSRRDKEKWIFLAEEIVERCHWLILLPYHRFWSHVAYDPNLHEFLETYLCQAHPPSRDDIFDEDPEISNYLRKLHSLFFRIFSRMSTWRESKKDHISPMVFGQLLYSCYTFDIPKLFDLCSLYHKSEKSKLQKMLSNIFSQNIHYHEDLETAVEPCIVATFDTIEGQLGVSSSSDPKPLVSGAVDSFDVMEDLLDLLQYSVSSLDSFFEIYPPAIAVFHSQSYHRRLAEFYDLILPAFTKKLLKFEDDFEKWAKKLNIVRLRMIRLFRKIISTIYLRPVLKDPMNKENKSHGHVEKYIQDMMLYLSTPIFLEDYNSHWPVSDDLDLFVEIELNTEDLCSLHHLKKGISELDGVVEEEWNRLMCSWKNKGQKLEAVLHEQQSKIAKSLKITEEETNDIPNSNMGAAACPVPTEPELVSLITHVQDLFPDFGDGFVEECLEYYAFSSEDVINALVEENLPEHLILMDRSFKRKPKVQSEQEKRVCVFDNDEFDIHRRRNVDTSKIHTEKSKHKNMDKKYGKKVLEEFRPVYELYNSVDTQGSIYTRRNPYLNFADDDEYDDTYDSYDAVPDELCGRSETIPRVLAPRTEKVHKYKKREESESEEETDTAPKTNFRAFASDPAEIREQRRNHQQNRRPPKNKDVVGNPRGQGQDKQTLINRSRKEENKSSRANHNRKQGAQWKRSKAMF